MAAEKRHSIRAPGRPSVNWLRVATGVSGAVALAVVAVVMLLFALYGPDSSVSLDGAFLVLIIVLGSLGLVVGLVGRSRRWWMTWGIGIAAIAALVVGSASWWIRDTGLVTQGYPASFFAWVWGSLFALGVALTGWWDGAAVVRVVRFVTVPITLFGSFLLINSHYGYWPTMGALLNRPLPGQVTSPGGLSSALKERGLGSIGRYGEVSIPSPAGFDGGSAWAWIPPDFNQVPHADLPVLLMLPGWPGDSANWARAGEVIPFADAWAKAHHGAAPVMVFVSGNGASDRDTECVNGTQGPAETYLSSQVPRFITHVLGIKRDPARWGVVGFSEGGTCAIGLATEHPGLYGRFIDISGELIPSFGNDGDAAATLSGLFAGKASDMLHHEPVWLMAHHTYPESKGWFAAGDGDRYHERIAAKLTAVAREAGMDAFDASGGAGGHSWSYARSVFDRLYPALVASMSTASGPSGHRATPHPTAPHRPAAHKHRAHKHRRGGAGRNRTRHRRHDRRIQKHSRTFVADPPAHRRVRAGTDHAVSGLS